MPFYIDVVDFSKSMYGNGNAVIARSAVKVVGSDFVYVGVSSIPSEVGKLVRKCIEGRWVDVYSVGLAPSVGQVRLVPENIRFVFQLLRYMKFLSATSDRRVFTRTYSVVWLLALTSRRWDICYYIPGLGNPMTVGRRPRMGKYLVRSYDFLQSISISRVRVLFAAASVEQIQDYVERMKFRGVRPVIHSLPTAANLDLFTPQSRVLARESLGLDGFDRVLVFVGRLAEVKGIPLLFDTIVELNRRHMRVSLVVVGDGELKGNLVGLAAEMGIGDLVLFLGNQPPVVVSQALAACDVFVMASYTEGFSNAMVEAVASGRPIVSTRVSGVSELVLEGRNGYIVDSRSPVEFANKIVDSFSLLDAETVSRRLAVERFSDRALWDAVNQRWLGKH